MKHLTPKNWLKLLPLPWLGQYRFDKIEKRLLNRSNLFGSYQLAYDELKEETGLIYIHLGKTRNLKMKVRIYDRLRRCYTLNLDDYEFVLQKRTQLVRDRLKFLLNQGDFHGAMGAIKALLEHIAHQCQKGFIDRDSGVNHNYGFIGEQVVHFDAGRIVREEGAKEATYYLRELVRVGKKIEDFFKSQYPEQLPLVEETISEVIHHLSEEDASHCYGLESQ